MRRRSAPEALVVGLLVVWTLVPMFTMLGQGGVFNGGYGIDRPDLMQYMAFIRDAGNHVLISNQFDVAPARHLLLDPGFALSGLLWRLGASIQLALLVWVPIALVALCAGFVAYARRLLGRGSREAAVALLLAFFLFAPAKPMADWLGAGANLRFGTLVVSEETFAGAYAWGTVSAISVALMPVFLLTIERLLVPKRRAPGRSCTWYASWALLTGLLVSWLHPWQGMTLLVMLAGLVLWGRVRREFLPLLMPAAAVIAPLGYYAILSRTHSAFGTAGQAGTGYQHLGWWFVLGMAPFLLAAPGFPGRDLDLQQRLLRLWPVAALIVYLALDRTWFYHALDGITLPLGILAVGGWRRLRRPVTSARLRTVTAVSLIAALLVPGIVWVVLELIDTRQGNFFRPSDARALTFLARASPAGPVLAPVTPLGQAVPAFTGRRTYVGHYEWTPDMAARTKVAEALFAGRLSFTQASDLVRVTGVRFLAADCAHDGVDLGHLLGPLIVAVHRFGCATVYEVRR